MQSELEQEALIHFKLKYSKVLETFNKTGNYPAKIIFNRDSCWNLSSWSWSIALALSHLHSYIPVNIPRINTCIFGEM